jgi:hypothetical protein
MSSYLLMLCGIDAKLRSMLIIVFNYNSVENSRQQKKRETVREREEEEKGDKDLL